MRHVIGGRLVTAGVLLVIILLTAGCAQLLSPPPAAPTVSGEPVTQVGLTLPTGYTVTVAAEGLQGPTQMIEGPDGRLWVAQLNGSENAGSGQVVAVDLTSGASEVLLDGLLKPTGIAILDG